LEKEFRGRFELTERPHAVVLADTTLTYENLESLVNQKGKTIYRRHPDQLPTRNGFMPDIGSFWL
jgi:hypothetical protein